MTVYDVAIVGGGAAGLTAAIVAAERGRAVVLLEASDRVGKKLLATGNGRCNLAPVTVSASDYNCAFATEVIGRAGGVEAVLAFFRAHGLLTAREDDRWYPQSFTASAVLGVLRSACDRAGVVTVPSCKVTAPEKKKGLWEIGGVCAKKVIVATGSSATFGLESAPLLEKLGLPTSPVRPSLVPLLTDPEAVKGLRGVRVRAALQLVQNGKELARSQGEVQFKDNGISGIAVFDLSCVMARRGGEGYAVRMDFFPDRTTDELTSLIAQFGTVGVCHKELAQNAQLVAGTSPLALAKTLKSYTVRVRSLGSMALAQVVSGGVRTTALQTNLASTQDETLFVVGEAVDVDGRCGGYNLLWAWASGMTAGASV